MITLFSYYRSSSAYRVRIALNLKQVEHKIIQINLLENEQSQPEYLSINPQGLVPSMKLDTGDILTQSQAIIEYLDREYPEPNLLSKNNVKATKQRAIAAVVACEIHPLNNLKVLQYLRTDLEVKHDAEHAWYAHWVSEGFDLLEKQIEATPYSNGEDVSLVDVFLIPQVFNALRFNVDMNRWPKIQAVYMSCNKLPAFIKAAPENQIID